MCMHACVHLKCFCSVNYAYICACAYVCMYRSPSSISSINNKFKVNELHTQKHVTACILCKQACMCNKIKNNFINHNKYKLTKRQVAKMKTCLKYVLCDHNSCSLITTGNAGYHCISNTTGVLYSRQLCYMSSASLHLYSLTHKHYPRTSRSIT